MLNRLAVIIFLLAIILGITANIGQLSAGWAGFGFGIDEPASKAVTTISHTAESGMQRSESTLSRTQMSILLGVGLVGLISFSRRKINATPTDNKEK